MRPVWGLAEVGQSEIHRLIALGIPTSRRVCHEERVYVEVVHADVASQVVKGGTLGQRRCDNAVAVNRPIPVAAKGVAAQVKI